MWKHFTKLLEDDDDIALLGVPEPESYATRASRGFNRDSHQESSATPKRQKATGRPKRSSTVGLQLDAV